MFAGRTLFLCLEELAEDGLRGEAEAVGNFLDAEAGSYEIGLRFAQHIVRDDLLRRLADDSVRYLREIACCDTEAVGIELDIVGLAVVFGNERDETVVDVDGSAACLVGFCIDDLRVDEVVGVADGRRHVVAHAEPSGNGSGESSRHAVPLPTVNIVGGEETAPLQTSPRGGRLSAAKLPSSSGEGVGEGAQQRRYPPFRVLAAA